MSQSETQQSTEEKLQNTGYGDLQNLARSMREQFEEVEVESYQRTKDELVEDLAPYEPEGSREDGWTVVVDDDRVEVETLDVQTPENRSGEGSSGPSDTTVFYCLTRAATDENHIQNIRGALEEAGYEFRAAGTNDDKFSIVEPAPEVEETEDEDDEEPEDEDESEADEEPETDEEEGDEDADEESDEDEESEADESESDDEEDDSPAEEDESDETESDDDSEDADEDADEDDEDEQISADVVRDRWNENKSKQDLYEMAVDEDISGRSDMTKEELIDALIEERDEIAE